MRCFHVRVFSALDAQLLEGWTHYLHVRVVWRESSGKLSRMLVFPYVHGLARRFYTARRLSRVLPCTRGLALLKAMLIVKMTLLPCARG